MRIIFCGKKNEFCLGNVSGIDVHRSFLASAGVLFYPVRFQFYPRDVFHASEFLKANEFPHEGPAHLFVIIISVVERNQFFKGLKLAVQVFKLT